MDTERANSRIHVCVRLRPLISEDYKLGNVVRSSPERCVHLSSDGQTVKLTKDQFDVKLYRVDHTFDEASSQVDVYNLSYKKIVIDAINGYHGTGMVYGQTGTGKSHTMFGSDRDPGLVQLAINDVFTEVRQRLSKDLIANVFLSFYQLYLEQAFDLLAGQNGTNKNECVPLAVREDAVKGAFVENLQYIYVDDESTTMDVLRQGLRSRRVQSTQYNMSSSRSHAIFQMYLDFEERDENGASGTASSDAAQKEKDSKWKAAVDTNGKKFDVRRRVLTFVDLAGSERVQTHHQAKSKTQFKESVTINKSISALGNCIQALASMSLAGEEAEDANGFLTAQAAGGVKRASHVPFRDCKLTRLLAEPLGGNSKTCIIVNIGPCSYNYEETNSTMKFARRAMTIRKKVKKGEIEQLQVQDIVAEELPAPASSPSPPRISLGGRKETNLKLARIVVRDSPEERVQVKYRYADAELDLARSGELDSSRTASSTQRGAGGGADDAMEDRESGRFPSTPNRDSGGYFLHVPAGSAFDPYGTSTIGAGSAPYAPSVRLNLGDFLKACQVNGYRSLSSTTTAGSSSAPEGNTEGAVAMNGASYVSGHSSSTDAQMRDIPMGTSGQSSLKLDVAFTPIAYSGSSPAQFPDGLSSASGPDSLSWPLSLQSPSSGGKTFGLSEESDADMHDVDEQHGTRQGAPARRAPNILLPSPHPNLDTVPRLVHEDSPADAASANGNLSSISAASPARTQTASDQSSDPVSDRKQRRFVWERGSGEVNQTVDITPLISRYHRGRDSSVAAVAAVPHVHTAVGRPSIAINDPDDHSRDQEVDINMPVSPSKFLGRKVTSYLQYTPSAVTEPGSAFTDRSNASSPDPTEQAASPPWNTNTKTTPSKPPNGKRPGAGEKPKSGLTIATSHTSLRDETNSLPRSGAPKPSATASPQPQHVPTKHPTAGSAGPYTFHKSARGTALKPPSPSSTSSSPGKFPLETPRKKSVNWGDKTDSKKNSTPSGEMKTSDNKFATIGSPAPALAATIHPFGSSQYVHAKTGERPTAEEIHLRVRAEEADKRAAAAEKDAAQKENGGRGEGAAAQTALVKLVQELRDELLRKEAEISSLKSFILNN